MMEKTSLQLCIGGIWNSYHSAIDVFFWFKPIYIGKIRCLFFVSQGVHILKRVVNIILLIQRNLVLFFFFFFNLLLLFLYLFIPLIFRSSLLSVICRWNIQNLLN